MRKIFGTVGGATRDIGLFSAFGCAAAGAAGVASLPFAATVGGVGLGAAAVGHVVSKVNGGPSAG